MRHIHARTHVHARAQLTDTRESDPPPTTEDGMIRYACVAIREMCASNQRVQASFGEETVELLASVLACGDEALVEAACETLAALWSLEVTNRRALVQGQGTMLALLMRMCRTACKPQLSAVKALRYGALDDPITQARLLAAGVVRALLPLVHHGSSSEIRQQAVGALLSFDTQELIPSFHIELKANDGRRILLRELHASACTPLLQHRLLRLYKIAVGA
jgi:hypothetical protein